MRQKNCAALVAAASGIALAVSGELRAENADTAPASDADGGLTIQEVVVTAQKKQESAEKVPLALTVFSGDVLKDNGVVTVADLPNIAPALSIGRSGASGVLSLTVRGVTTSDTSTKGDQNIAFIVDGIPINRSQQFNTAFFDIDRIELLRGPQGTLYGKSTTGGVLNIVTGKPKDEFDASADVEYGNYSTRRGDVMVNVPVTDYLAFRVAGNFNIRDGYLNPVLDPYLSNRTNPVLNSNSPFLAGPGAATAKNDENDRAVRLTGRLKLGEHGSLTVTGTWTRNDTTFPANALIDGVPGTLTGSPATGFNATVSLRPGSAARQIYYDPINSYVQGDNRNVNAELQYSLGPVQMTADWAKLKYDGNDLSSSYNNPLYHSVGGVGGYQWEARANQFSTDESEVRFSNANPGPLQWVLGANYSWENLYQPDMQWTTPYTDPSIYSPAAVGNLFILSNSLHLSTGYFGQASYNVTDKLKLTAGGRESFDTAERRDAYFSPGFIGVPLVNFDGGLCFSPQLCKGGPENGYQNASKFTWRLGADYQLTDQQMVYASVATGYKAGSFNDFGPAGLTSGTVPFGPEDMIAFEAGFKGDILPALRLNSSFYYYDYKSMQVLTSLNFNNGSGIVRFTRDVPATMYGWENELEWRITSADRVDASLYLEHANFKTLMLGRTENIDWSGHRIGMVPAATGTVGYTHRWLFKDGSSFDARGSVRYNSGYELLDLNVPVDYHQKSFTRSDVNLTYTTSSGKYAVMAYARNIENKLQMVDIPQSGTVVNTATSSYQPAGVGNVPVSDPRTFGIRMSYRY